ncbi:MAG: glutamine-synthetase adenylyltransferase, partial [Pseudomonadota bacterium]
MFNLLALSDQPVEAVALAAAHSPYLGKLQTLTDGLSVPEAVLEQAMALCASVMAGEGDPFADLRRAKALAHVAIAASDLSGRASLSQTTQSITEFADAAVKAALSAALRERELAPDGLFVFALGKMGAFELNYSSDIDVSVFFDP